MDGLEHTKTCTNTKESLKHKERKVTLKNILSLLQFRLVMTVRLFWLEMETNPSHSQFGESQVSIGATELLLNHSFYSSQFKQGEDFVTAFHGIYFRPSDCSQSRPRELSAVCIPWDLRLSSEFFSEDNTFSLS